ncbi:MAG TPA: choice-of-anchor tandem repeat NxxGxxAF-containing protein, partial [Lacipirellulaceae bacterium]
MVAREEDQAPGTPSGVKYDNFGNNLPAFNSAGQIAFRAILTGVGVDSLNDEGLWSGETGNVKLVVRGGDRAPGTPDEVYFGSH